MLPNVTILSGLLNAGCWKPNEKSTCCKQGALLIGGNGHTKSRPLLTLARTGELTASLLVQSKFLPAEKKGKRIVSSTNLSFIFDNLQ